MSLSAANSHHVVSELRLLISLNQDDPMGEMMLFNPDLPPVFDEYQEEDEALVMNTSGPIGESPSPIGGLLADLEDVLPGDLPPGLPPVFDNCQDDIVMIPIDGGQPTIRGVAVQNVRNYVLPLQCLNESAAYENRGMYWTDRWKGLRCWTDRWGDGLIAGYRGVRPIDGLPLFGVNSEPMNLFDPEHYTICLTIETFKVFNPGILTAREGRISQPLSRHLQAQELGQFFLKKGRMIRIR